MLTVIGRADNYIMPSGQHQTMWNCICECGSVVCVRGSHLKDGFTKSCGCVKSFGEYNISQILTQNGVRFRREVSIDDCINKNGNRLKFDFGIYCEDKLIALIEYQGEQHYKAPSKNPFFGKLQREETDQIKKDYCYKHNIPLYEIRYDEDILLRVNNIIDTLHDNTVPSSDNPEKV